MQEILWWIISILLGSLTWILKSIFQYFKKEWEEHKVDEKKFRLNTDSKIKDISEKIEGLTESLHESVKVWAKMSAEEIVPLKKRVYELEKKVFNND